MYFQEVVVRNPLSALTQVDYELFQIEISKSYGTNDWQDDMRRLLMMCGTKQQRTTFLFSDTQVTESAGACSYYSISTGMQTATPPGCTIFDTPVQKCLRLIHSLYCQKCRVRST